MISSGCWQQHSLLGRERPTREPWMWKHKEQQRAVPRAYRLTMGYLICDIRQQPVNGYRSKLGSGAFVYYESGIFVVCLRKQSTLVMGRFRLPILGERIGVENWPISSDSDNKYRFRFLVREMTIASIAAGSTAAIAVYVFYACNKRCQGDRDLILPAAAYGK